MKRFCGLFILGVLHGVNAFAADQIVFTQSLFVHDVAVDRKSLDFHKVYLISNDGNATARVSCEESGLLVMKVLRKSAFDVDDAGAVTTSKSFDSDSGCRAALESYVNLSASRSVRIITR